MMSSTIRHPRAVPAPPVWVIEPMSEFVHWTREELDIRYEAQHRDRQAQLTRIIRRREYLKCFGGTPNRTLVDDSSKVDGTGPVLALWNPVIARSDRPSGSGGFRIPRRGIQHHFDNFLGDVLERRFHADLHPANLRVLPGKWWGTSTSGLPAD